MATKLKRGDGTPAQYDVMRDGEKIGSVRKREEPYMGSTLVYWSAFDREGRRIRQVGAYLLDQFELAPDDGSRPYHFMKRARAVEAVEAMADG